MRFGFKQHRYMGCFQAGNRLPYMGYLLSLKLLVLFVNHFLFL